MISLWLCLPVGPYALYQSARLSRAVQDGDELTAFQCRRKIDTAYKLSLCVFIIFMALISACVVLVILEGAD